jgi:hypothetical protein
LRLRILTRNHFLLHVDWLGNFVDFLLKPLQRFADTFTNLREAAGSENNQHDGQNDDQLRDAHRSEHGSYLTYKRF